MKFILGTKEEMTQIFDETGKVFPVTVISAGPITVTQVKTLETDGYDAVQVGYGVRNKKNLSKAVAGHLKGKGEENFMHLKEFRGQTDEMKDGDVIDLSVFEEGELVQVSGTSKGKGFQGVVKRHNFSGGPRTHGNKHHERTGGSIGSQGVARVFKGMRMPGRMGSDRITTKSLKVVSIDKENGKLYIQGAVPGRRGSLLEIRA